MSDAAEKAWEEWATDANGHLSFLAGFKAGEIHGLETAADKLHWSSLSIIIRKWAKQVRDAS